MSNISKVLPYSFRDCVFLISAKLPDSIIAIGKSSFSEYLRLKSIKIPKDTILIENDAFYYCSELENISFSYGLTDIFSICFSVL